MTPEQLAQFNEMRTRLGKLEQAESVPFIESLKRQLNYLPATAKLSDLADVEGTDGATTGQVLKKTATTWQPGTDNT